MYGTDYHPAPQVLERLRQVSFVGVVAPTATGKTTTINDAMKRWPELHVVPTTTSRPPRPGEVEGVDYFFRSEDEMLGRIERGEYVQVAPKLLNNLYATAPEGYATEGVAVMAILADSVPTFRALPFKSMRTIFMVPPSWEVWQERLKTHSFTLDQLKSRIHEATASLRFGREDTDLFFIVNDSLEQAAEDLATIAFGWPMSERLQADQVHAREIVKSLLDRFESETAQ